MEKILIVEDEPGISDLIRLNLNMAGYATRQSYDGIEAIRAVEEEDFDLVLLDVMLPKLDGFSIMEKIRGKAVPVIFITAKDSLSDRVKGLKMGADDYIIKPFEAMELLARIEAVLRRSGRKSDVLKFKDIEISEEERTVKKSGSIVELTTKEFELLKVLVENKGRALSREMLLEKIWGYDYVGETRTVDMHVQKLRKKMDLTNKIKTIYKIGYRLEE